MEKPKMMRGAAACWSKDTKESAKTCWAEYIFWLNRSGWLIWTEGTAGSDNKGAGNLDIKTSDGSSMKLAPQRPEIATAKIMLIFEINSRKHLFQQLTLIIVVSSF